VQAIVAVGVFGHQGVGARREFADCHVGAMAIDALAELADEVERLGLVRVERVDLHVARKRGRGIA
jgi:hypothetical protein